MIYYCPMGSAEGENQNVDVVKSPLDELSHKINHIRQYTLYTLLNNNQKAIIESEILLPSNEFEDEEKKWEFMKLADLACIDTSRDNPYSHFIALKQYELTGTPYDPARKITREITIVSVNLWEPKKAQRIILPVEMIQNSYDPKTEDSSVSSYGHIGESIYMRGSSSILISLHSETEPKPIVYQINYHDGHTRRMRNGNEQIAQSQVTTYKIFSKIIQMICPFYGMSRKKFSLSFDSWQNSPISPKQQSISDMQPILTESNKFNP